MHFHLHVKHWVVVWFWMGIVCGVVAMVNIFARNLSPEDIKLALFFGIDFWVIGGLACYGFEGVRIEQPKSRRTKISVPGQKMSVPGQKDAPEWHSASDFLIPGNHRHLL